MRLFLINTIKRVDKLITLWYIDTTSGGRDSGPHNQPPYN